MSDDRMSKFPTLHILYQEKNILSTNFFPTHKNIVKHILYQEKNTGTFYRQTSSMDKKIREILYQVARKEKEKTYFK